MNTKTIAIYLPQFYETSYNNKWWGKGYTEWTACKGAKKLYRNHYQPREPHKDNYYSLDNVKTIFNQARIARDYGIDGFAIYHYYFNGKTLLENPINIIRNNPNIDIDYFLYWANHDWKKSWFGNNSELLVKQEYGEVKEWREHFNYCNKFFKDSRYIKVDNKPVFFVYDVEHFIQIEKFIETWNKLAIKEGYSGIYFVKTISPRSKKNDSKNRIYSALFEREPFYSLAHNLSLTEYLYTRISSRIKFFLNKFLKVKTITLTYNYDKCWKKINKSTPSSRNTILGAFNDLDTSPRKGYNSLIFKGASPKKFQTYFEKQLKKSISMNSPMLVINAWNEWAEGAYLEPDKKHGYGYLEAIYKSKLRLESEENNS